MASFSPPPSPKNTQYACDTLPAPQNLCFPRGYSHPSQPRSPSPPEHSTEDVQTSAFDVPTVEEVQFTDTMAEHTLSFNPLPEPAPQPPARKLCVRHQRMADEGTILKLQKVRLWMHTYMVPRPVGRVSHPYAYTQVSQRVTRALILTLGLISLWMRCHFRSVKQ